MKRRDFLLNLAMILCTLICCAVLGMILGFVLIQGAGHLTPDFLHALAPQLMTTLLLIGCTLVVALPVGVGAAIYLTEYAKPGPLVNCIRFAVKCLSSIPSIIYGLFGMVACGTMLRFGFSLATGIATLGVMVLPTLISATEEALMGVPQAYREGAWALGAGKLRTTFVITLRAALPGVITAAILTIGRIMGETAAVYLTVGTMLQMPSSLLSSGRTLAVHLYLLAKEAVTPDAFAQCYATAALLILVVLLTNLGVRAASIKRKVA